MSPRTVILLVLVAFSMVPLIVWRPNDKVERILGCFVQAAFLGLLFAILCAATTTKIYPFSLLLTPQNLMTGVFPDGTTLWKWDNRLRGATVASYSAKEVSASIVFSPITKNPKVRNLTYEVKLETIDTPDAYVSYRRALGGKGGDAWLKYQLYEFNEKFGSEIARFYNPIDDSQQEEFEKLIRSFLDPKLPGSGMAFRGARFNLS